MVAVRTISADTLHINLTLLQLVHDIIPSQLDPNNFDITLHL